MLRPPRHLRRYREIVRILGRHGFGDALSQLGVGRRLGLPVRLLRRDPADLELTRPERVRLALEELGPTFIKFGQIISTRADLLPGDIVLELVHLQDRVTPTGWSAIKKGLRDELNHDFEDKFSAFDTEPIASASIAQVLCVSGFLLLGKITINNSMIRIQP